MLNTARRTIATRRDAAAAARRATTAARAHLSSLPLTPGMAARVDCHRDQTMGHLVTITAWWDHPVTGARVTAQDTVPAASGPHAAEKAAARVVNMLHTRLRADRMEADA